MPAELGRELSGLGGPALFITRNNLAVQNALRTTFPHLEWEVLTKEDMRGWGARRLLAALRRRSWNAVIVEDRESELRRRRDLYRLLLLSARTGSRWILATHDTGLAAESVSSLRGRMRMSGVLLLEAGSTVGAILSAWLLTLRLDRSARAGSIPSGNGRVAMFKTQFWFDVHAGGSVSHVMGVAGGMRALGLEPRLYSTSRLPDPHQTLVQVEVPPQSRPSMFEEAAMAGFNRSFLRRVRDDLSRFRPAVVYHRHDVLSLAGLAGARRLGVPLVLEVNASEVWARRAWSRLFLNRLAERMERVAFRRADRLVLISEELVPTVLELGGSRERIVVNPNGVDVDRFDPEDRGGEMKQSLGFPLDSVVCGFLGTFARWHGVLFLAEQVPLLVGADPKLRFLFLGEGDHRPEVESRIREGGCSGQVRFTGLVPPHDVPRHLAACDILLSPHLPFEDGTEFFGSPTKLFEYMAAGRAIVASRLGSIARLVKDGQTGILVTPGDGAAFRAAVLDLAERPDERSRLGRAARAAAERRYTWKANVRRALQGLVDLPPESDAEPA